MELPCASGVLCVQTEELGVGWPRDGQLSTAYRAQKNSLGSTSSFVLSIQDLLPVSGGGPRGTLDSRMIALACS